MKNKRLKSKMITVSLRLDDIRSDPDFSKMTEELANPEGIKTVVLERYFTDVGKLEGIIEGGSILILQWCPDNVDDGAEALYNKALNFAKSKQYEKAVSKWKQALSINGEDVDYLYKIGIIYFEMRNFSESINYLEKAVKICPIHYKAHLILGMDWIKLRKFDKAEKYVLESQKLNRSNVLTYLNLGAIYTIQKRFNEAIEMFNTTIMHSPKESRAYLGLAKIYNMLNDVETSNSYFKKVIELSPDSSLANYAKRSIQALEQNYTDAVIRHSKEELISKGMGLYLSGKYDSSIEHYKAYLNEQSSDDYVWYLLGESKLRNGEVVEASECFKRAIKLNPKKGLYYKSLGISFHFLGKPEDTLEVLKKAVDKGKNESICYTLQGINLMRLRKFDEAINTFKLSLKSNQKDLMAMYNLALAYVQNKENNRAVELLKDILLINFYAPVKAQAKNLLKIINSSSKIDKSN